MTRAAAILCLIVLAALAKSAHAVNIYEESIDWAAHRADVIVRGNAVSVTRFVQVDTGLRAENRGDVGGVWQVQVTLSVTEVLKGTPIETCTFQAKLDELEAATGAWVKDGGKAEALFFLNRPEKASGATAIATLTRGWSHPFPVRDDGAVWAITLEGGSNRGWLGGPPLDLFGTRLEMADAILTATREAVRQRVMSPDAVGVPLVDDSPGYRLIVPIDARLEPRARRWLREGRTREIDTAMDVLAWFPSDENASVLTPFLNDTSSNPDLSTDHKWKERHYLIRKRAYDIVRCYGRDVSGPPLQGLAHYAPIRWLSPAGGGGALLLLIGVLLVRRHPLAAVATASAAAFALLVACLLVRDRTVHEVIMSVGSSAYEAGSYPDGIHLKCIHDWPTRASLSYGQNTVTTAPTLPALVWEPRELPSITDHHPLGIQKRAGFAFFDKDWSYPQDNRQFRFEWLLLPHWMVLTAFALLPSTWLLRLFTSGPRRRAARIAKGLCGECGYDVRVSTGGRCPECGAAVAVSTPPRASASRIAGSASFAPPG